VAGQTEPEHPAPVLTLTAAVAGDVSTHGAAVVTASPAGAESDSDGLAVAAIIVGGVGLVIAVAAIALARKRTPSLT
jgi:uncharacterized protein